MVGTKADGDRMSQDVKGRMEGSMEGRCIVITGAGRPNGQGAAEARMLLARGASVVIGDVCDGGEELADALGPRCRFVTLDVTKAADWEAALALAAEFGGGLHGLVNNAAIYHPKPLHETSEESFRAHCEVNQVGPFLGMKLAAPLMAAAGGGSIVNISSTAGLKGSAGSFAYSATKWALRGMTKSAALSLAGDAIRVNSVHPGPVGTDMIAFRTPAQRAARQSLVPLGREGGADEVAELVCFLLSDASAWITGAEVAIDGGISL